jgi:hypothetical protein
MTEAPTLPAARDATMVAPVRACLEEWRHIGGMRRRASGSTLEDVDKAYSKFGGRQSSQEQGPLGFCID